jgi:hypothetical protein
MTDFVPGSRRARAARTPAADRIVDDLELFKVK